MLPTEPTAPDHYCLIEDWSEGGVRIRTRSDFEVTSVFILRIAEREGKYKVAWRKGQLVGAAVVRGPVLRLV
jgi:hypothetical protein